MYSAFTVDCSIMRKRWKVAQRLQREPVLRKKVEKGWLLSLVMCRLSRLYLRICPCFLWWNASNKPWQTFPLRIRWKSTQLRRNLSNKGSPNLYWYRAILPIYICVCVKGCSIVLNSSRYVSKFAWLSLASRSHPELYVALYVCHRASKDSEWKPVRRLGYERNQVNCQRNTLNTIFSYHYLATSVDLSACRRQYGLFACKSFTFWQYLWLNQDVRVLWNHTWSSWSAV